MAMIETGLAKSDGADIYFERRGDGPALLLISGGGGDAGVYTFLADVLAADYTVLTYDRRGNSRSPLHGPPTTLRPEEQSADAVAVLDANGFDAALAFGSSAGAVIGFDLVARHPSRVVGLVAHEAPVLRILPEAAELLAFHDELDALLEKDQVMEAYIRFMEHAGLGSTARTGGDADTSEADAGAVPVLGPEIAELVARMQANIEFFMRYEMRAISSFVPDYEALRAARVPMAIAGGLDTGDAYYNRTGKVVADELGIEFVELAGDHLGYGSDPVGFARGIKPIFDRLAAAQPST
ncbi:MAG TPA: alpha/beta hydrolase [Acidimicrobiales bacterium]|nr:alpha/beta hydrolase [Acidimicrobiales bacterium]